MQFRSCTRGRPRQAKPAKCSTTRERRRRRRTRASAASAHARFGCVGARAPTGARAASRLTIAVIGAIGNSLCDAAMQIKLWEGRSRTTLPLVIIRLSRNCFYVLNGKVRYLFRVCIKISLLHFPRYIRIRIKLKNYTILMPLFDLTKRLSI